MLNRRSHQASLDKNVFFEGFYETDDVLIHSSYILRIGIYPTEINTYDHTANRVPGLTMALFLMAPKWKRPSGPATSDRTYEPKRSIRQTDTVN